MFYRFQSIGAAILLAVAFGCAHGESGRGGGDATVDAAGRRVHELQADAVWQLDLPGGQRFDASGLGFRNGTLLTVNDRGSQLYTVQLGTGATAELERTSYFPAAELARAIGKPLPRYDVEAIAVDEAGRVYICEESKRAVFRFDPEKGGVEMLRIDWGPAAKYFADDPNASFEGIAAGNGLLYLANERNSPRIVVVELSQTGEPAGTVVDSFFVNSDGFAFGGAHYSGLAFHDGHLFVLDRNHRSIMEVDPGTKAVVAEYRFGKMELTEDLAYKTAYPTGTMEGLAVDDDFFWLVTDNNGQPRFKHSNDRRPTLFRCKRSR